MKKRFEKTMLVMASGARSVVRKSLERSLTEERIDNMWESDVCMYIDRIVGHEGSALDKEANNAYDAKEDNGLRDAARSPEEE